MNLNEILQLAQEAARAAGDYARSKIGSAQVSLKAAEQIVTQVDQQCQKMIVDRILEGFPDHGIIGEEGTADQTLKRPPTGDEDIWWIIDPLDGTRNYAHGAAQYAVSIGVMRDGLPVAGAIYDPSTNMMFSARQGGPAECNGQIIHCRDEILNSNSQLAISGNIFDWLPLCVAEIMEKYTYMNLGSAALHYAYVAMGAYSAAFAGEVKLWDIAAGAIISQCAGAVVNDLRGKARFPINPHDYQSQPLQIIIGADSIQRQLNEIFSRT